MPVSLMKAGNNRARARNMDAAAMNQAKHIRQRCRAIRCLPNMPLRTNLRTSPAAAISATVPRKMYGPGGYSYFIPVGLFAASIANVTVTTPSARTIRRAPQSKIPVPLSLRLAVIQAVATK